MRHLRRKPPTINTGSMADIAFLLLIFFLVTAVIPNNQGFNRKLPKPCLEQPCEVKEHQHNVLRVLINKNDELLVNNTKTSLEELMEKVKSFVDNNKDASCSYCEGAKLENASDNPQKAVISLQIDRETTYDFFIQVQDEITKAYYQLRENYAMKVLKKDMAQIGKEDVEHLRKVYPFILSEAVTKTQ